MWRRPQTVSMCIGGGRHSPSWRARTSAGVQFSAAAAPGLLEIMFDLPNGQELFMNQIPAGSFPMGSPDAERSRSDAEGPLHTVTFAYGFYLGKFEVTQGQWQALMGSNPAHDYGTGDNYPVYYVSWHDSQAFVAALNGLGLGGTFRLPSEAEWEYGLPRRDGHALLFRRFARCRRPSRRRSGGHSDRQSVRLHVWCSTNSRIPTQETVARTRSGQNSRTPGASTT